MNFKFNKEQTDDKREVGVLDKSGIYTVSIRNAYIKRMQSGAEAVHFDVFGAKGGTGFDVWVTKKNGEQAFGCGHIQSLMGILGIKELKSGKGTASLYDVNCGEFVDTEVEAFPDLIDKIVVVALRRKFYIKQTGDEGYRFELLCFLGADYRRYSEIENGEEAQYYKTLKFNDLIDLGNGNVVDYLSYKNDMKKNAPSYKSFDDPKDFESPLMHQGNEDIAEQNIDESLPF